MKHDNVLLIRKNRPSWQAGRLNGLGGKVKKYENFYDSMVRECSEECGLVVTHWAYLGLVTDNSEYIVKFYRSEIPNLEMAHTTTDEPIEIHNVHSLDYDLLVSPTDVFLRLSLNFAFSPIELIME
ncbi:NUDIX domain-containing protein, partial [bacterium]|nr:NUDIX domain-containing protein [bacterium]